LLTKPPEDTVADIEDVVQKAQRKDRKTARRACPTPALPTMMWKRRKISTPHMFSHVGTKTPANAPFLLWWWWSARLSAEVLCLKPSVSNSLPLLPRWPRMFASP